MKLLSDNQCKLRPKKVMRCSSPQCPRRIHSSDISLPEVIEGKKTVFVCMQTMTDKALEVAVSFSQSLTQWAYIVIGGSVAFLLHDLKYRPKDRYVRHSFWIFVPGWIFLALSIYEGIRVQQRYVGRWMSQNPPINDIVTKFNRHTFWQILFMEIGLFCFGAWLIFFLARWIIYQDKSVADAGNDDPC